MSTNSEASAALLAIKGTLFDLKPETRDRVLALKDQIKALAETDEGKMALSMAAVEMAGELGL
jgi:hypothetical protein